VTPKKKDDLTPWLRLAVEIGAILVAVSLAYSGLDKRLAVIENKVQTGLEAQKDFASKAALQILEERIQRLEERRER